VQANLLAAVKPGVSGEGVLTWRLGDCNRVLDIVFDIGKRFWQTHIPENMSNRASAMCEKRRLIIRK